MSVRVSCLGVSDVISKGVKTMELTLRIESCLIKEFFVSVHYILHLESPTIVSLQQQSSTFTTIMKIQKLYHQLNITFPSCIFAYYCHAFLKGVISLPQLLTSKKEVYLFLLLKSLAARASILPTQAFHSSLPLHQPDPRTSLQKRHQHHAKD